MKFLVGITLFLNVWLWAGTEIPYSVESISQFKEYRKNLLELLKNQKKEDVVSIVQYVKERAPDEFAIDNLELIQIYLLVERYDLALDLWIGEYEKVGRKVQYSFVRDSLLDYLDANMNLTDSSVVKKKLKEVVVSNVDEEQRGLYKILLEMTPFYEMQNKFYAMHYKTWDREQQTLVYKLAVKYVGDSLANSTFGQFVFENRVIDKFYYRSGINPECIEKLILLLKEFERNFPNSERLPWIKYERNRFEKLLKDYSEFLNYHKKKLYS